jgi:murein peptide amidase A
MNIFRSVKHRYWKFSLFLLIIYSTLYNCAARKKISSLGSSLYSNVESKKLPWKIWAKSIEKKNIRYLSIGEGKYTTLILGAFHGSEPLSAQLAIRFAEYLFEEYKDPLDCNIVFVPIVIPDGLYRGVRTNANGVDINRNFPTKNWSNKKTRTKHFPGKKPASEPETKAVIKLIKKFKPDRIVSIHTPLRVVNYDGPAQELAFNMSMFNGYPMCKDIGYPTPGSLGNYAGTEKNIPTITLELPRKSFEKIWEENREALMMCIIY